MAFLSYNAFFFDFSLSWNSRLLRPVAFRLNCFLLVLVTTMREVCLLHACHAACRGRKLTFGANWLIYGLQMSMRRYHEYGIYKSA